MTKVESHRDLIVWQKAMDLTVLVYQLAGKLPSSESYRLVLIIEVSKMLTALRSRLLSSVGLGCSL